MPTQPGQEMFRIRPLLATALLLVHAATVCAATATGMVTLADTGPAQGLAGAMVSDGLSIVRTDAAGRYELPLSDDARFIMAINPPGCEPQRDFYHRLPPERPDQVTADFSFRRSVRPVEEPFRFAHISDSHGSSIMRIAERIITQINALPDRPAFVLETGDISCHTGDANHPMESYGQHLAMPYFPVTGNHDAARAGRRDFAGAEFEDVFGPWYYAWTSGRYLFVGLPWSNREGTLDGAAQWLERLLTMNAETEQAHVVVGLHYWDGFGRWGSPQLERFLTLFRDFNVRAVLMGHWHLARVHDAYGIPVYMTRNPVMGNRDLAAGGFLLFNAQADGTLSAEFRVAGHTQHVAVAWPPAEGAVPRGPQPVAVNAYDTALQVRSVTAAVQEAATGLTLQEFPLDGSGGWTWLGEMNPGDEWPQALRLLVTVVDESGQAWPPAEVAFEVGDTALPAVTQGANWSMLQQNPGRTGVSPDTARPPFALAWAHATGAEFGLNSPIIMDGAVYVSVENNLEPRVPRPSVVALDAVTGDHLWTHALAGRTIRGTLAGGADAICALADDGTVIALDPRSGRLLWEQGNLVAEPVWKELFNGSPVLLGSTLVAGAGHAVAAYDAAEGRILWEHSVVAEGGRRWTPDPSPAVAEDSVLLAWTTVHALSADRGEPRWESADSGIMTFTPTVAGGRVITVLPDPEERTRYHLDALDAATGERLWRVPLTTRQRGIYTSPVATENRVYAFDDQHLHAVDLESGEGLWQLRLTDGSPVTGAAAMSGDHLVYAHSNGRLVAVNVATRQVEWSHDLGTRLDSSPAISGNALYVTARDGTVYAFVAAP